MNDIAFKNDVADDMAPVELSVWPRQAPRLARRKDYLLLKEKMTCSVYVSYKSSSASDVSDAGWL
jgi:hypothetical protein